MQAMLHRLPGVCALLWIAAASGAGGFHALGANPSWRGTPFRCVYTNGNVLPDLAQASTPVRVVTAKAGTYLYSTVPGGRRGNTRPAVHFFDGSAWRPVLHDGLEGFTNLVSLHHVGLQEQQSLLFLPGTPPDVQPIWSWDGAMASWLAPGLAGTNPIVAGGRILHSEGLAEAGMRVLLGPPGAVAEILNDSLAPGLSGSLALDSSGQTVLFATGSAARTNAALWMRRPDGTLRRLIADGDPLPGSNDTAAVRPSATSAFADGSYAYLVVDNQSGGRQRDLVQVLFRSDGDAVEPLLAIKDPALGVGGAPVIAFAVGSVTHGEILATATFEGGRRAVIHWQDGVWTELVDPESLFDGEKPFDFALHREGHLGDSLALMISFGSARRPVHRLYTNARFSAKPVAPHWTIRLREDGRPTLTLEGRASTQYQVLRSGDLRSWSETQVIRTSDNGRWVIEPGAGVGPEYHLARELPGE